MTLSDWRAVTEPLGHRRTFSAPQGSAVMPMRECVFLCVRLLSLARVIVCRCICVCVGGQFCTDYLVHLDDSESGWASLDRRVSCKAGGIK